MRLLGIDYGSKKVGVALTDPSGFYASAYSVVPNNKNLVSEIKKICEKEKPEQIIIGDPTSFRQDENPLRQEVKEFAKQLSVGFNIPIHFQTEAYTSKEAERLIGRDGQSDARAAALILKSYIDQNIN